MMDFDEVFKNAALPRIYDFATSVKYHASTGVVTTIKAFINKNVEVFHSGFESSATERRTEIVMQKVAVPHIKRGEIIVSGTESWEVQDIINDDGFEVWVTVK